jgi:4-hydroxy-3-methylbut-2-enyl diphosphate reductase
MPLKILLANPRGFCAGVERAIEIVELALEQYGPPVYVRHEIVHNKYVVDALRNKGAVFVEEIEEIPEGAICIYSAHGVSKKVRSDAENRDLRTIDATCPLVTKVHVEAEHFDYDGYTIILIGHEGHPEVEGTMGQLPNKMLLVGDVAEAESVELDDPEKTAVITQTTLSVDDTKEILDTLIGRFPGIRTPKKDDICYATTNRQHAVKELVKSVDVVFVLGAPNSSNSNRLREVAETLGVPSYLIQTADEVMPEWLDGVENVGVTAGASAPEVLVQELVDMLVETYGGTVDLLTVGEENISFPLPPELTQSV